MLKTIPIPAFSDNYIWLLHEVDGAHAWVCDPGDAAVVERYLEAHGLTLSGIFRARCSCLQEGRKEKAARKTISTGREKNLWFIIVFGF